MLLLLLVVSVSALDERITNGITATAGGNPNIFWQARLTIDGRFFCGGTIISSNTILTAGHCVRQLSNPAGSDTTFSPKSVLVCLGTDVNACTQYALGDRMYVHPTFVSTVQFSNRIDLTVLKLQTPITTSANIGPLTLASTTNCPTCESSGANYIVSGFGNQNADGGGSSNPSSVLKYVQQTFVSRPTCVAANPGLALPATALCAGPIQGQSGTDSCQGDSGGPLAALVNGQYYLTGVVQTGTSTGGSQAICGAPGSYGVYVSVRSLNTWITDAMNESPAAGTIILSGAGSPASIPSSGLPFYVYIIIGVVGGVVLLLILIGICCCCKNRDSDARRHQAAIRAANKQGPQKMGGAAGQRPPVSPRGQAPMVQPAVVNYAPLPASNRPPVRPEYALPSNPSYGVPLDPAVSYAPPPPPMQQQFYAAPPPPQQQQQQPPQFYNQPAVYAPQPVVYTPKTDYGRM